MNSPEDQTNRTQPTTYSCRPISRPHVPQHTPHAPNHPRHWAEPTTRTQPPNLVTRHTDSPAHKIDSNGKREKNINRQGERQSAREREQDYKEHDKGQRGQENSDGKRDPDQQWTLHRFHDILKHSTRGEDGDQMEEAMGRAVAEGVALGGHFEPKETKRVTLEDIEMGRVSIPPDQQMEDTIVATGPGWAADEEEDNEDDTGSDSSVETVRQVNATPPGSSGIAKDRTQTPEQGGSGHKEQFMLEITVAAANKARAWEAKMALGRMRQETPCYVGASAAEAPRGLEKRFGLDKWEEEVDLDLPAWIRDMIEKYWARRATGG
ncbi:hypothetical protein BDZ91DRAFT_791913 [Kalaharituber pfeilii]|nr:hypothetical protein BDZ91DRAFT_791913 [Kalaharituber pfeilii]